MIENYKSKNEPHFLFENEHKFSFCNEPKFYVYWEISSYFEKTAQLIGLPTLMTINSLLE